LLLQPLFNGFFLNVFHICTECQVNGRSPGNHKAQLTLKQALT